MIGAIAGYKIKNKALAKVAEQLSDQGYNPDWRTNDNTGDWKIDYYGEWDGMNTHCCEAIVIPNNDGFGDMVGDAFLDYCDKPKEIDWKITRWERVIWVKREYNKLTEEDKNFLYGEEE